VSKYQQTADFITDTAVDIYLAIVDLNNFRELKRDADIVNTTPSIDFSNILDTFNL